MRVLQFQVKGLTREQLRRRRPGRNTVFKRVFAEFSRGARLLIFAGLALIVLYTLQWASAPLTFNTDFTSAGVGGMRGKGTASLALNGVSGIVTQAYLTWHGPTDSTDPAANAQVTVNGIPVRGANTGFSSDNNWPFEDSNRRFANSQSYRADVTEIVASTGNGTYELSDFTKPGVEINGASLIVFFADGNPDNNHDVVMFNGNDSNDSNPFDAPGWNVTLSGIDYSSGAASLQLHVSDGQSYSDDALILNGLPLAASGAVFQGDSVPPGVLDGLWDIRTFDITSVLKPGANTLSLTTGRGPDALSLNLALVILPPGAAPRQATPAPLTFALTTGLGGIGGALWNRHKNKRRRVIHDKA